MMREREPNRDPRLRRPHILLLDDNAPFRTSLREWIEHACPGCQVHEAGSGEAAVAHAARQLPELAIIDVDLPGMNGFQTTQEIKRRDPTAQVIILTIHEETEYRRNALAVGAAGFVPKSSMGEELLPLVRAVLNCKTGDRSAP